MKCLSLDYLSIYFCLQRDTLWTCGPEGPQTCPLKTHNKLIIVVWAVLISYFYLFSSCVIYAIMLMLLCSCKKREKSFISRG